jgi:ActR/RegA family two-component response regulator
MSPLSSLLLVDTDPRGLEALTYGFEREGCTVSGTSDLGRAADLARTAAPQLAVVSLRERQGAGIDLLQGLRGALAGTSAGGLPVVTLGPPAFKAAALAAGASDFLATPLFVRDVISVGRLRTLEAKLEPRPEPSPTPDGDDGVVVEIESRLAEYHGFFYLLRLMAVTGRSGILVLSRGNRRAEVRFSDGTVVTANVGGLQGLPAVHNVLLWEDAVLSFRFRPIPRQAQLSLTSEELLDECERFLRDLAFAARELGPPRVAYAAVASYDTSTSGLQPSEVGPVLRLFDGQRTLLDAIEESPFSIFDTIRVVRRLLHTGALAAQGQPAADGPRALMEPWAIAPDVQNAFGERRRTRRRLKPVRSDEPAAPIPLTARKAGGSGPIRKQLKTPSPLAVALSAPAPAPVPVAVPAPAPVAAPAVAEVAPQPVAEVAPPPAVVAPAVEVAPPPVAARSAGGDFAYDPTVQVKVDPAGVPLAAPLVAAAPAPLTALEPRRPTPAPMPALGTPAPVAKTPPPVAKTPRPRLKTPPPTRLTPSTAFDAVEADFFAREKDLYEPEKVESFDDLDGVPESNSNPYLTRPPKKKR